MRDINHGIGIGTFQDGSGGYDHTTTAYGIDEYYTIHIDGSIEADQTKNHCWKE